MKKGIWITHREKNNCEFIVLQAQLPEILGVWTTWAQAKLMIILELLFVANDFKDACFIRGLWSSKEMEQTDKESWQRLLSQPRSFYVEAEQLKNATDKLTWTH